MKSGVSTNELQRNEIVLNKNELRKRKGRVLIINETIEISLNALSDDEVTITEIDDDTNLIETDVVSISNSNKNATVNFKQNLKTKERNEENFDAYRQAPVASNKVTEIEQKVLSGYRVIIPDGPVVPMETEDGHNGNPTNNYSTMAKFKSKKKSSLNFFKSRNDFDQTSVRITKSLPKAKKIKKVEFITKKYPNLKIKNNEALVTYMTEPNCLKTIPNLNEITKSLTDSSDSVTDSLFMEIDNGSEFKTEKDENKKCFIAENELQLIQCPYCNYKSPKGYILKKHIITYHTLMYFTSVSHCPHCDFVSDSSKQMLTHLLKHDEKKFKCPLCDIEVEEISLQKMKNHFMSKHTKTIFQQCMLCQYQVNSSISFVTQSAMLREHILNAHFKDAVTSVKCPICDFTTSLDLELKSHIYMSHQYIKGSVFSCVHCKFISLSISELLSHSEVHDEKSVKCNWCRLLSFNELWFNLHRGTHAKALFKCPYCHVKVRAHYLLKYHVHRFHKTRCNVSNKVSCAKLLHKRIKY